jgi:tetratricopeptide (TPR) repeat protein
VYESQGGTLQCALEEYNELSRAVELDSKFVDAYYMMFCQNWCIWCDELPPYKNHMANCRWWRDKIAAVSTNCPQYHFASAGVKAMEWHCEDAIAELEVSLKKYPNFRSDGFYGFLLLHCRGDAVGARAEWKTAERVNGGPDLTTEFQLGTTYYYERDLAKAIEQFKRAAAYEPRSSNAHEFLSRAYEASKQYLLALDEGETADKLVDGDQPGLSARYATYRSAFNDEGPQAMWRAMLKDLKQSPAPDPRQMAKLYARLDQKEEALHWLERVPQGQGMLLVDDCWDRLRDEPRFKELLRKEGLPDVRPGRK